MGYSTFAYGVDIDQLRAAYGSKNHALLVAVRQQFAERLACRNECNADGDITDDQAIAEIIDGTLTASATAAHRYGYALEYLCGHIGRQLENDDLIKFIDDDLEIDTVLAEPRLPLPIPTPHDFPIISFLTAAETRVEHERLKTLDVSHDDEDIAAARGELVDYLRQASEQNVGIVTFSY